MLWEPSPASPVDVVAHHEAGHTIVAVFQHEPLHSVEIFSDGSGGRFRNSAKTYDRQELDAAAKRLRVQGGVDISVLRPTLIGLLAGPIAEHRITNGHVVRTRNDSNTAKILLDTTNLSSEQRRNLSNECFAEARRIIDEFWGFMEVLAIRLIRRRYLDADEIRSVFLA